MILDEVYEDFKVLPHTHPTFVLEEPVIFYGNFVFLSDFVFVFFVSVLNVLGYQEALRYIVAFFGR